MPEQPTQNPHCAECDRNFATQEGYAQHMKDRHGEGKTSHDMKAERKEHSKSHDEAKAAGQKASKRTRNMLMYGGGLLIVALLAFGVTQLLNSSPATEDDGTSPQLGAVGGVHTHQDFKIYLNGEVQDFSGPKYQVRASHVHVEGGDGDLIHTHATGVTLGYFLKTIGWRMNSTCVSNDRGEQFCNGGDKALKFYVDSQPNTEFGRHLTRDLEKILISFGNETEELIQAQLSTITNKAPVESAAGRAGGLPSHIPQ